MNVLNLQTSIQVLKLTNDSTSNLPLLEQVRKNLEQCPYLFLDVNGIQFNSMLIGEVVNVYQEFKAHWSDHMHQIALINVSEFSVKVFQSVGLTDRVPVYESVDAALADIFPDRQRKIG